MVASNSEWRLVHIRANSVTLQLQKEADRSVSSLHLNRHTISLLRQRALVVHQITIDERLEHLAVESRALQRGPAALVQQIVFGDGPGLIQVNQDKVGVVPFAEVAALGHAVEPCRAVAHFLHDLLQRNQAAVVELEHAVQGVLYHGRAGHRLEIGLLLFLQRMGRMIGGDKVDAVVKQGFEQTFLVLLRLDGRVPFDERAQPLVVLVGEPQVVDRHFGGDFLLFQRDVVAEQVGFRLGGQVQDMEAGAVLLGQAEGALRGFVASFRAADDGVELHRHIVAVHFPVFFLVLLHDLLFFRVDGDDGVAIGKQLFHRLRVVGQQIALLGKVQTVIGNAHQLARIGLNDFVQVIAIDAQEEGVIGQRFFGSDLILLVQALDSQRIGDGVGHIDERGNATRYCRFAFGMQVCFMGSPRVPEVHLPVDNAREEVFAFSIDDFVRRLRLYSAYLLNAPLREEHIGDK